jgi:soluble lytic murein transglycosylase-like protein
MNPTFLSWILYYSALYGVDPLISQAIVQVESNGNPDMIGELGEVGLMQIMETSSKYSKKDLLNPKINIKEGIHILKLMKNGCKHQIDFQWVICYNKGIRGGGLIKYPDKDSYYSKVKKQYERSLR